MFPFLYTFSFACLSSCFIHFIYKLNEYTVYYCFFPIVINILCFCGIGLLFGFNIEERKTLKSLIFRK